MKEEPCPLKEVEYASFLFKNKNKNKIKMLKRVKPPHQQSFNMVWGKILFSPITLFSILGVKYKRIFFKLFVTYT
jgi:hypothetical protein